MSEFESLEAYRARAIASEAAVEELQAEVERLTALLHTKPEVPAYVMHALDRMCTPLHESHLKGATAEADAHCMKIIRDYILAASEARDVGELTDEQWYDLAQRHANADWNSDGYLNSVKTLCSDFRSLATRASEAAPVAVGDAKSERVEIPQEVIQQQESLMHPATQVFFRAGLLACREYMARFAQHDSPIIAASIRANWWPSLGQDFGPPRKLNWSELTEGESGEDGFRAKAAEEISPTQEALPIALQFLQSLDPAYGRATIGTEGIERSIKRGVAALASQAVPDTATTVYSAEFVRNKFADYETQILNLREELAARGGSQAAPDAAAALYTLDEARAELVPEGHVVVPYLTGKEMAKFRWKETELGVRGDGVQVKGDRS